MIDRDLCCGCSACVNICPTGVLSMQRSFDGFDYPERDPVSCCDCGLCDEVCPLGECSCGSDEVSRSHKVFALKARDAQVRLQSTSGGVFHLLARKTIEDGGVVFGAAFDGSLHLRHVCVQAEDEIASLLKTKYVQSDYADSFVQVRDCLAKGRRVLYCGNPCAVHGLLRFLGGHRAGLLLVDHVCFGVPSPGFWEAYVAHLGAQYGPVAGFDFRGKAKPDDGHTLTFTAGGETYAESLNTNRWCRIFFKGISLRSSCLSCRYCTPHRASDLTLGDFWGIEGVDPGFSDGYGVSLAITQTDAGIRALEGIAQDCEAIEVDIEKAMQPRLSEPTRTSPLLRKLFLGNMRAAGRPDACDMEQMLKKYGA